MLKAFNCTKDKPAIELSLKQRQQLQRYQDERARTEWPSLREALQITPPSKVKPKM